MQFRERPLPFVPFPHREDGRTPTVQVVQERQGDFLGEVGSVFPHSIEGESRLRLESALT